MNWLSYLEFLISCALLFAAAWLLLGIKGKRTTGIR